MNIQDLQDWVAEDWSKRATHSPSRELQVLYLLEEIGEIAEAIRKTQGNKQRISKEVDIGAEFADAFVSFITLANTHGVNLTKELAKFQDRLASRR